MPAVLDIIRVTTIDSDGGDAGVADPGDGLRTQVTITNSGDEDADNTAFSDTFFGSTIVADSINISPVAVDDVFDAVGNTQFLVGGAAAPFSGPSASFAGNLLSNDTNFVGDNFPGFTLTSVGTFATTGSGSVVINADGSFAYNPAAGFTGADTFTYTLRDAGQDGIAGNSDDLTSTATVTVNVANPVWYVDQAYDGSNGASDGTSWRPFTSMAPVNGAGGAGDVDGANHFIHVRGDHTANIVLEAGQSLVGNGAALVVGGYTLTSAGVANTLSHGTGTGVQLAYDNSLRGFTLNGTDAAGVGIADNNDTVGNLFVSGVTIQGSGKAVDIDQGGTLNVTFDSLSSAGSATEGVHLQGVGGSFTANGGTIQTSVGQGFLIGAAGGGTANSGGNANITYGGQITNAGGAAVEIQDRTGGTVTFSGNITEGAGQGIVADGNSGNINFGGQISISSGASNAITLTNNAAAIAFTPTGTGLDITTTTGTGFRADGGGGTVTLTGAGNTVQTGSGRAVEIDGVTIGGAGVTFLSVGMSDGDTNSGIFLRNAGSGGFTITGSGSTAGSGGTISSIQNGTDGNAEHGTGIYLENTNNISLSNMAFTGDFANFGIRGVNVSNFTLRDSTANAAAADNGGFGNSNAADEGVISFDNLSGTALFEGNNLSDGHEDIIVIDNTTGTLSVTVRDSVSDQAVIGNNGEAFGSATGNDGILINTSGNSNTTVLIEGVTFEGARGDMVQVNASGAAVQNITIRNNTMHNDHADIVSGGGGMAITGGAGTGAGYNVTYNIEGNSLRGAEGTAIFLNHLGGVGTVNGTILNNTIGLDNGVFSDVQASTGANNGGNGISVGLEHDASGGTLTHATRIEGNIIGDIRDGSAIFVRANGDGVSGAGVTRLEATIRNNTIDEHGVNSLGGIYALVGGAGANDDGLMGLNIENNVINLTGATNSIAGIIWDDLSNNGQFYFPGFGGPYTDAGLGPFHTGAEGNTITIAGTFATQVLTSPTGTLGSGSAFVLPVPIMAAEPVVLDWEAAVRAAQLQAYLDYLAAQQAESVADGGSGGTGGTTPPTVADEGVLSQGELALIVDAAIARWAEAGASEAQIAAMRAVAVSISDLGGLTLGLSAAGTIVVDDDAGGWRWFVDATPGDDGEFTGSGLVLTADSGTVAGSRIDLLTVIMHELGHQIGLEDDFAPGETDELMFGTIRAGERRLPGADEVASATGTAVDGAFAISPINLGTLIPGQVVTIDWLHTIDTPAEDGLVGGGGQALVDSDQTALTASLSEVVAVDGLTLGDQVFFDADGDSLFGAGDSGIAGVTLTLYADTNDNGVYDPGTDLYVGYNELGGGAGYQQGIDTPAAAGTGTALTATTDGSGNYSFNFLAPGDYIVVVDAANFTVGNALEGLEVAPSSTDPDNNVDNDNNAQTASGATASQAIRLDYDQEPTAGLGNDTNNTVDLGFADLNEAPAFAGLDATPTFIENGAAVVLDGNATVTDPELTVTNYAGATLTLARSGGADANDLFETSGTLTFGGVDDVLIGATVVGSYAQSAGTLVITFDANATQALVNATLQQLTYRNTSENPGASAVIAYVFNDGNSGSQGVGGALEATGSITVSITEQDDLPVAQPDAVTTAENAVGAGSVFADNGSGVDSDPDGPALSVSAVNGSAVSVGNQITLASGALLTLNSNGTYSYDPNGEFDYLISTATAGATGAVNDSATDSFTYTLDGGNTVTVTMTVTGVDGPGDELLGTPAVDTITGTGGNDVIRGLASGDFLDGADGDDAVYGNNGNDTLAGGADSDELYGGRGVDRLIGGQGADSMFGGDGNDTYQVSEAGDLVFEAYGEGIDRVFARVDYTLTDNVENLRLIADARSGTGNGLDNAIFGSGGDDTLFGLAGEDRLFGLDGNDTIEGGDDADRIWGGLGTDILLGGDGDDWLEGGAGTDTLTGGAGRDVFVFREGDTAATWVDADVVTDFNLAGTERLRLDAMDADTTTGGDQAFSFIGAGAFTGVAGELHYVQSGGTTYVEGDTDGDSTADFVIALTGTLNLLADDFVL